LHAGKLERQAQFLKAVTTSIGDWLTVSAPDGRLIYAKPAFAEAVGLGSDGVTGRVWSDVVKTAAIESTEEGLIDFLDEDGQFVEVNGERRAIALSTSALSTVNGVVDGIVRVARDCTESVAQRQGRLRALVQTVDAFVHAVERRDPFLLGHTRRLRRHAIAVGRKLGLTGEELASLALAASLSQIGKIFVPDHILTMEGRHGPEERELIRRHILHAIAILERIDFVAPIVDIIAQMHERLDGGGYPHGLAGEAIGMAARILGVADVFCARTAPRSYRARMSVGKTLRHLASNGQRYDLNVVAALADVVGELDDIDDAKSIERSFIDASIWREDRAAAVHGCDGLG
jgi:PAS domain S-box-containing protein